MNPSCPPRPPRVRRMWLFAIVAMATAWIFITCSQSRKESAISQSTATESGEFIAGDDTPDGLSTTIIEASAVDAPPEGARLVEGKALNDAAIQAIYARLEALPAPLASHVEFALRSTSQPAPRVGDTIEHAFPPDATLPTPTSTETNDFNVLRFSPEGDVDIAPNVSVTFSTSVVPLTGQQDASKTAPATIAPSVNGAWRWVGTQTALFDPEDARFPMSSDFTVTPDASLKSANGQSLEGATAWTFTTPTVRIEESYPRGQGHKLSPLVFLRFNQDVNKDEILKFIEIRAGSTPVAFEVATLAEIQNDEDVKRHVARAPDARWIAVRPAKALPAATKITVALKKNAPSAEGPRTTPSEQTTNFRTYDAFAVQSQSCDSAYPCQPNGRWYISFNNPIDVGAFEQSQVSISPPVEGLDVTAHHGSLQLRGRFKARTTYTVTLDASLKDAHGQTLAKDTDLEFHIGEAPKQLGSSSGVITTLDPALKGRFPFYSTNYKEFRVRAWKVEPKEWSDYLEFLHLRQQQRYQELQAGEKPAEQQIPGKQIFDEVIEANYRPDEMSETLVDLARALNNDGHGHVLVWVQVADKEDADEEQLDSSYHRYRRTYIPEIISWVQVTDIALHAFIDGRNLLSWTSKLSNGEALEGVDVEVAGRGDGPQKSGKDGLAQIALKKWSDRSVPNVRDSMVIAKVGTDVAILPEQQYAYDRGENNSNWTTSIQQEHLLWHVFDDRGIYQPGEDVHVKGWIRNARITRDGSLRVPDDKRIEYRVQGPRGNTLAKGKATVDASGGFDFDFSLADDVNLGHAHIQISADSSDYGRGYHNFQIQEFRRPEFEVNVSKSDGPYIVGEAADLHVAAQYYAGGGLSAAPVTWTLRSNEGRYSPPGNEEYTFGRWNPWWWWGPSRSQGERVENFESTTDASGEQHLNIRFDRAKPALPMVLSAGAAVQDVNRQTWQSGTELLVHPSSFYVGLKSEQNFVEEGKDIRIDAIVTDIDGEIQSGQLVRMQASRLDWKYEDSQYHEVEVDTQTCDIESKKGRETCTFKPKEAGAWRVRSTVYDAQGRPSMSELRIWVGAQQNPPQRRAEREDVRLIPEKETHAVGDTAKVMVLAPFADAEALMTVRQDGIVTKERFKIEGDSHEISVKIGKRDVPNVYVQVDLVGSAPRTDAAGKKLKNALKRPAWASGQIMLKVPPVDQELQIEIQPQHPALKPGQKTYVDLQVNDASGAPAKGAHVALIAVDEAILALTDYTLSDPIETFFPQMQEGVEDLDLHSFLVLASNADALNGEDIGDEHEMDSVEESVSMDNMMGASPPLLQRSAAAKMGSAAEMRGAGGGADAAAPIEVRKDFNPLAAFAPAVRTDDKGKARVSIELPDNLTRYRLMAVAVKGADRFGKAEENMTARLPLMVRPSPPRFLNYGDVLDVPVVLQNQTDNAMEVQVAIRASNLKLTGGTGKAVTVPANDRIEVRFPAEADAPGTAHIQVAASSGSDADASTHSFPVWTPATTEAFATYGTIDRDGEVLRQPVAPPSDALTTFGSVDITTSSTAVQSLTDALIYLVDYPFDSAEQLASRILGVAALRDVLGAFEVDTLPKAEELVAAVDRDLEKLRQLQRRDGGFQLWSLRDRYRMPFVEVHVVHALWRAEAEGFSVNKQMLERATTYIENIEDHIPSEYSAIARNTVRSYALYVLDKMGKDVLKDARMLSKKTPKKELSLESIGWLMSVLKDDKTSAPRIKELTRYVQNRVDETAAAAQFTSEYEDGDYVLMHSDRRTDAILLEAWMQVHPDSDLIAKVVRGLQAHQTRGRWGNTQENVFVLLALEQYFKTYEEQTPDFVASVWLGADFAGSHTFKGREVQYENTSIPMKFIVDAAKNKASGDEASGADLTLQKVGKGRMYYRLGMNYALKSLEIDPAEYGFAVTRAYEGLDNDDDVRRLDDGSYEVKLGSRVRVTLTMVAPARRYHVALVDKLPAGFEALNPALAVSEDVPSGADDSQARPFWWWFSRWYSHQNLRTERAEAFSPLVYAGTYEYSYVTRATTPGTFVVPPAKAEEMYHPETFGRTGSAKVVVK